MSNFLTLSQVSGGLTGTAPRLFTASTNDNLAAITASGYVSDLVALGKINVNDILWINIDVDGTISSGAFIVNNTGGGSLAAYVGASGSVGRAGFGIKSGITAAYAGGGTSNTFVATGLAAGDIVTATVLTSTTATSGVARAVPSANSLAVDFTADPGAGTTVQWHAITP